jgi:hypothetical protein
LLLKATSAPWTGNGLTSQNVVVVVVVDDDDDDGTRITAQTSGTLS